MTIREQIQNIDIPELREKLLVYVTDEDLLNDDTQLRLSSLVSATFEWDRSPEGYDYWWNIHQMLMYLDNELDLVN